MTDIDVNSKKKPGKVGNDSTKECWTILSNTLFSMYPMNTGHSDKSVRSPEKPRLNGSEFCVFYDNFDYGR